MITEVQPFEAKFEDLTIYFHKLNTNLFYEVVEDKNDVNSRLSAYTDVRVFYLVTHHYTEGRSIIGDVLVMFRNQGEDFDLCLNLTMTVTASSKTDNSGRSVFNKLIQYLFEWAKEYVKENNIRDNKDKPFVMPSFGYSPDMFKGIED